MLFEDANIAAARNIGVAQAAGDIVAFIDDDAVPEPGWLQHLVGAFDDQKVAASGGYVLGKNGISLQFCGQVVDRSGFTAPLAHPTDLPVVYDAMPDRAIKTIGTNCAFRRNVFSDLSGFHPAFAFYLDETEFNMRLAKAGMKTAIVPLAQVHHSNAASERRFAGGCPKDLSKIGASVVAFLRIHAPDADHEAHIAARHSRQINRLLRFMVTGACEPRDVGRLMQTFENGVKRGKAMQIGPPPQIEFSRQRFVNFSTDNTGAQHCIVAGYRVNTSGLRRQARAKVRKGGIVSLYLFSRTALFHRVRFHRDGYWQQIGGLFGRARRSEPIFGLTSLASRIQREDARVAAVRHP
ncbi:MAG: glycosyltransferase family 2 protein [Paracoccaceae bacterium]